MDRQPYALNGNHWEKLKKNRNKKNERGYYDLSKSIKPKKL